MCSVHEDRALYDWLRWAEESGPSFLRTMAEASFMADLKNYNLLQPVLLELKKDWPKPARETLCGDATDFREENRWSRNTSTAYREMKTGVLAIRAKKDRRWQLPPATKVRIR
jgi:hypothetical protein